MASVPGLLTAGACICSGFSAALFIFAVIFQVVRENVREAYFEKGTWKAEKLAQLKGKPSSVVSMLTLGGIATFVKALAYWGMLHGVGLTGPVATGHYWGSQLGWIFYMFFAGTALVNYVCVKGEWLFALPYGLAAVAGTIFVATFAPGFLANQIPFAILGPVLMFVLLLMIGLFKLRTGWPPIVAIVAMALVYSVGYYLPYILSPRWIGSISVLSSLIWYLIADGVVALWFVFLAWTAIDCSQASVEFAKMANAGSCKLPSKGKAAKD